MLGLHVPRRIPTAIWLVTLAVCQMLAGQSSENPPAAAAPSGPAGQSLVSTPEKLTFRIEWRLITAGTAKLQRSASHLTLRLESVGLVSKLYKVEDTYNVDYDPGLCATSLHLAAQEGRRKRDTRVTYDRTRNQADYFERDLVKNTVVRQSQIDIPNCVHDVPGALHALRALRLEAGQSVELPVSDGKKSAMVKVDAVEREIIKVNGRLVKTIRHEAFLFNGVIYARKARLFVWLTDDDRRMPVQLQVRMSFPIGTVTLMLDKEETL
jgi:hypothetical protein